MFEKEEDSSEEAQKIAKEEPAPAEKSEPVVADPAPVNINPTVV